MIDMHMLQCDTKFEIEYPSFSKSIRLAQGAIIVQGRIVPSTFGSVMVNRFSHGDI